ncbi:hypothetical protein LJC57_07920 [Parabacteroides sp. OttesenSCG-928-G07]|nr:hypothetical protein [Parabacteroides sp. OttesenSCG-928-G21]MDL2278504.1 hypothetical protein [Parabacteroides sp. OttesenSCG-928-G07]
MNKRNAIIKSIVVLSLPIVVLAMVIVSSVASHNATVKTATENKEELVLLIHNVRVYTSNSDLSSQMDSDFLKTNVEVSQSNESNISEHAFIQVNHENLTSGISTISDRRYMEIKNSTPPI